MATIYISVGSNVDRDKNVRSAIVELRAAFGTLRLSSVYESEAVGFSGDNFYNLVVEAQTDLPPKLVVAELRRIENNHHRDRRQPRFSPRSLDLDLLLYDDVVCEQPVRLPREEILQHAFVLAPLAELAPSLVHRPTGQTYQALWQAFSSERQSLWKVNDFWNRAAGEA